MTREKTETLTETELTDSELSQVAGGTGGVIMDDDGCELPPGDLPHDQIPSRPGPLPTPCDPAPHRLTKF